jgi:hypothetical protein
MPNQTFKRWTADDIAKLKNLAQKQRLAAIADELGRSHGATAVMAHKLGLSLKMSPKGADRSQQAGGHDSEGTISQECAPPVRE